MTLGLVLAFLGVCLIAYITPGPDWFVVMRYTALSRWRGLISALGVQAGLALHLVAAALGVTAGVLAGPTVFTVLRFAGAAYLVFLGVHSIVKALRDQAKDRQQQESQKINTSMLSVFWGSFLANALNPQAAVFFVAVLPQFINPAEPLLVQIAVLGLLDIGLGVLWWLVYIYGIVLIRRLLGRERFQLTLNATAGIALVVLGITLAFIDPTSSTP